MNVINMHSCIITTTTKIQNISVSQKVFSCPWAVSLIPLPPAPGSESSGFCSYNFASPTFSYTSNHRACSLPQLASFTQHRAFEIPQVVTCISSSFLFVAEKYSIARKYGNLFIHSSVNRFLGCFQLLASENEVVVNMYVHIFVWTPMFLFSLCNYLRIEWLGHISVHLTLWKTDKLFSKGLCHFPFPISNGRQFQLLRTLTNTWYYTYF